jgi:hypothetical protein
MSLVTPPDLLKPGQYPYLQNTRKVLGGRITARAPLSDNLLLTNLPNGVTSLTRLNDPYAIEPKYVYILGAAGGMYVNADSRATGFSGLPLSFLPYQPPASPQPWCYVADPSLTVSIPAYQASGYGDVSGMVKVRSDGTVWKTGVKEPQAAPAITVGTGTGPNWVVYRYIYRGSTTGAKSNPSPESVPQIVPQTATSAQVTSAQHATNVLYNSSQYDYNSGLIRTGGSVAPGTLTDYVQAYGFGLSVPTGVNIDGVSIALNWAGQYAGTGVIANAALFYQGTILGQVKSPGIQNSQSYTTATQGGGSDPWGGILTPAIVNDSTFGFGVQILTESSGGSDRSFLSSFTITVYYTVLSTTGTCTPSTDPQIDTIDVYRQTPGLDNFTYALSVPNAAPAFTDKLSDLAIASNPILEFDNYEPFPSIDLPRSGVCNVGASGAITWASGDLFNIRWLPGTLVLIGGVAYVMYNRPTSTTAMRVYTTATSDTGFISFGYPPTGSNVSWSIAEPDLAAQPSPVIWGPTPDNAGSFYFGLDPLNPGDLVWSMGNNFDSAPDTNRQYVCSPSETLMNGTVTSELSTVFSTDRFWLIYPNFSDAVAAASGTLGSQWTLVQSASTRGLYMRYAIGALGSLIAWRAKDGIFVSQGGGPEQDISSQIYNLFPHAGQAPVALQIGANTVQPPDDFTPNAQTIAVIPGYIFYDYRDIFGTPRTLVYDMEAKGWSVDVYDPKVNCHAWSVGDVYQILTGCLDGSARALDSAGSEVGVAIAATPAENGGSPRSIKRIGGVFLRALAIAPITVDFWADRYGRQIAGALPATAGISGIESDYLIDFTAAIQADVLDLAAVYSFPLRSGNWLKEWQVDWTDIPAQIVAWRTGMLSYGLQGGCTSHGSALPTRAPPR